MTLLGRASRVSNTDISPVPGLKPFLPLLLYVIAALLTAAIYAISFQHVEKLIEDDKLRDLGAVADAKVAQIVAWRESQTRSGEHLSRDSLLSAVAERWLLEGAPANGRKHRLAQILEEVRYLNDYQTIQLLDRQGRVRLTLSDELHPGDEERQLAQQAMERKEILFQDIHRDIHGDRELSFDLVAPLMVEGKSSGRVIGAVVLHIAPDRMLYPLLQLWPTQSASAETLLVRRDGDEVLFLNELRHRKGTALALRGSLNTPDLPAAMAVRGILRTADGIDYRGVPVVAEMRAIPGTLWFMVSKVDRDELFAPLNRLKQWSTGLAFGFLAIGGALLILWLRNYRSRYQLLQSQRDAAVERELLARHYEYLTKYANDIILVADETGKFVEANERAEQAYGYTRAELLEKRIPDLRDPAEDPAELQWQLAQIRQLGHFRFETVNVRSDGARFPVESSVRGIDVNGAWYLQAIIRDISERKESEEALRHSENLLNKSQRMARIGSWELDLKKNILYWTDENYRIFEQPKGKFGASYEAFLATLHPDDREMVNRAYTDSVKNKTPYNSVHRLLFPDRRVKFVQEWCETFYDEDGQPLRSVGTTQDVTVQQLAHNALRKSSQRIEDLYNHAPCGYHSLDEGGFIVQINDTELQWLGYTRDEVIGKINFADLLAPGSHQQFRDNYPKFKMNGYIRDLEYDLVRKDGTSFSVLLSATAVYDADGKYLMSRSTLFDITERKRAEDELRLHGAILSQMEEGVILVRADNGTIVYANPKFEQMFGYTPGEMVGLHVSNLNAPSTRNPEEEAQMIIAALQEKGAWTGEIINRKKDGNVFWCHASVSTFEHPSYGTVWVSTHQDISERRLAEKQLLESEARFHNMADNAPIMIWMADAQDQRDCHGCNYFNQKWYEFTGLPVEPVHTCKWQSLIHPDDKARCLEAYREAFQNEQPFSIEYRLRRHDGEFRWMQDSGVPRFATDGGFLGFIGTCLDVTDHKLFDEIRVKMEHAGRLQIAGEMASGLAHELSQPLSAANNYLSAGLHHMAESDWDKDKLSKAVRLAHAQTARAGEIVSHLKDMVRKRQQERAMLDINELIRDTVHFMEYEIRQKSVAVIMDFYTLPLTQVSRIEIEQVLINLIKNAIDAMDAAPRQVLRIATRTIESGFILVSVGDTGKGIAPDALDKVFNPFQSSKKEGLGLGLPICRSLIENHGGKIWAEQNGDEGAEFNFTLPVGAIYA